MRLLLFPLFKSDPSIYSANLGIAIFGLTNAV